MIVHIYLITNEVTGKYYVGQTACSVEKRFRDHVSSAKSEKVKSSPKLKRSMRHHGVESFSIQELAIATSNEQGDVLETLWISLLDARNPEVGYNLSTGGNSTRGIKWSYESKAAHSLRMLGNKHGAGVVCSKEKKDKIREALIKHPVSISTREKISQSLTGRPGRKHTEEAKIKISEAAKIREAAKRNAYAAATN